MFRGPGSFPGGMRPSSSPGLQVSQGQEGARREFCNRKWKWFLELLLKFCVRVSHMTLRHARGLGNGVPLWAWRKMTQWGGCTVKCLLYTL